MKPQIPPLRYALLKDISSKGPWNRRSLGYPGFPVELGVTSELHAAFLNESRTRGPLWCRVVGNPGPLGMTKGRATLPWRAVTEQKPFSSPWVGRRPIDQSGPTARHTASRGRRDDKG